MRRIPAVLLQAQGLNCRPERELGEQDIGLRNAREEETTMHHRMAMIAIVGAGLVAVLVGCQTPSQPSQRIEYFHFTYKIAHQQPNGRYSVPWRAQDGTCNGRVDLPQAQIIQWVQQNNTNILDCAAAYTLQVKNNRALGIVSVAIHGNPSTNQSDIQIRAGRAIVPGAFSEPTNMFLEGIGPITPRSLAGFTELNFGAAGPIFTSNRGNNSFFEHELVTVDLNARRVAGTFRFLASNMNDPSDNSLLIAMDGAYLMDID
jgi:hypothetical protein